MLRQRARKVGHGREQHTFTKRARTGFRAMGASGFRECFFDPVFLRILRAPKPDIIPFESRRHHVPLAR